MAASEYVSLIFTPAWKNKWAKRGDLLITVAILAQGTHWAVATSQAFFNFEALIDHAASNYLSKIVA